MIENKLRRYAICLILSVFCESYTVGLFISRLNFIKDIVWALPLITISFILTILSLELYYKEFKKND